MSISKLLAFFKYRLDVGSVFLTITNFIMLLMVVSEKVLTFFKISIAHGELIFTGIFIVVGLLGTLFFGQILIWTRYAQNYQMEANQYNPVYKEILDAIKERKEEKDVDIYKEA